MALVMQKQQVLVQGNFMNPNMIVFKRAKELSSALKSDSLS